MLSQPNLYLDLGNTRLKYWCIDKGSIIAEGAELHLQSPTDLLKGLIDRLGALSPHHIYISSVLDATLNTQVTQTLSPLGVPILFAQVQREFSHNNSQLSTLYDASKLGIDRWLQILALSEPQKHYIVIGCGTALTIDIVEDQKHIGGYIVPSLYLQRDALIQGTRQIHINDNPFNTICCATNTTDAVHHGILFGIVALIEKLFNDYPHHDFIFTGGDAALISQHLTVNDFTPVIEPALLLKGLRRYF